MTNLFYGDLGKCESGDRLKRFAEQAGSYFFEPETMRYFGSRLADTVYPVPGFDAVVFVTSEKDRPAGSLGAAWNGQRRYSVRIAWIKASEPPHPSRPDFVPEYAWNIDDVSEFGQFTDSRAAHKFAKAAAAQGGDLIIAEGRTGDWTARAHVRPLTS